MASRIPVFFSGITALRVFDQALLRLHGIELTPYHLSYKKPSGQRPIGWLRRLSNSPPVVYLLVKLSVLLGVNIPGKLHVMFFRKRVFGRRR